MSWYRAGLQHDDFGGSTAPFTAFWLRIGDIEPGPAHPTGFELVISAFERQAGGHCSLSFPLFYRLKSSLVGLRTSNSVASFCCDLQHRTVARYRFPGHRDKTLQGNLRFPWKDGSSATSASFGR
jgi:hypothetical protein